MQGISYLHINCHVCYFKKQKACVVWLMHCDAHFGQEGEKLGVSSTELEVDILPQRTSSTEENTFLCVVDRWNGIFLQDTDLISHSLRAVAAATDSVDSPSFLSKKINQRIRHFMFHCFLKFCYLVITDKASDKCTLEAITTPCCLFPCTKMVKLFPFKGNKSWCSSWDRKTARTKSK